MEVLNSAIKSAIYSITGAKSHVSFEIDKLCGFLIGIRLPCTCSHLPPLVSCSLCMGVMVTCHDNRLNYRHEVMINNKHNAIVFS